MSFKPKYTVADKILNNLSNIALAQKFIEQSCLSSELEAKLRRRALLCSAHASTALSGNKLSLKQVEALFAKRSRANK